MGRRNFILIFIISICTHIEGYGQHWKALGTGVYNNDGFISVRFIFPDSTTNKLYVGGNFDHAGNIVTGGIASWNGSKWDSLGQGVGGGYNEPILAITNYHGEIYAGGFINTIMKWDGTKWDSIKGSPTGILSFLDVFNNELYAGFFDNSPANMIAKWDGTKWIDLGFPYGGSFVACIAFYKGELYAGGTFQNNGITVNIAKLTGQTWNPVGNGIKGGLSGINSMTVFNGELYVGGYFSKQDGNAGTAIQKWNGNAWSEVGGSVTVPGGSVGQVFGLCVFRNELWAVGVFEYAGGVPTQYLAKWNGSEWCGLGSFISNNGINSIASLRDTLYIGGPFKIIDGDTVNYIAKWTGGNFVDTCSISNGITEKIIYDFEFSVYPNPASTMLRVKYNFIKKQKAQIELYDVTGKRIKVIDLPANEDETEVSVETFKMGMYFYLIRNNSVVIGKGKVVIE